MTPRFSVIIPTLNEEKFLPKLLDSLVAQTQNNFEVIVVDGKSKDKTLSVAKSFVKKLPALSIVVSKKAKLPLQRNLGAQSAKGKWLVFVDADSVLFPYFFERIESYLARDSIDLLTTWSSPDGTKAGDALTALVINMFWEGSILFKRQLAPGSLAIVSRRAFDSIDGYNESLTWGEDYDLSRRLGLRGIRLKILRETLYTMSLRRFRREGTLKVAQTFIQASLMVLITKRTPKNVPGYIMGGHLYGGKKQVKRSVIKVYEKKLKKLLKEFFG